jgi:hypothetical protein
MSKELTTELTVNEAIMTGNYDALTNLYQKSLKTGIPLKISGHAINFACRDGHLQVLRAVFSYGIKELPYDEHTIDFAVENGHVDILLEWINSGLELKYTENALTSAICQKNYVIIDIWIKYNLRKDCYPDLIIHKAKLKDDPEILDLLHRLQVPKKFTYEYLQEAANFGSLKVLKWWFQKFKSLSETDCADIDNLYMIQMKSEQKDSFAEIIFYKSECFLNACRYNQIDVINWYLEENIPLPDIDGNTLADIVKFNYVQVMEII